MDHGYRMHLANTAAVRRYEDLKYADDNADAYWLSNLLRLRRRVVGGTADSQ